MTASPDDFFHPAPRFSMIVDELLVSRSPALAGWMNGQGEWIHVWTQLPADYYERLLAERDITR